MAKPKPTPTEARRERRWRQAAREEAARRGLTGAAAKRSAAGILGAKRRAYQARKAPPAAVPVPTPAPVLPSILPLLHDPPEPLHAPRETYDTEFRKATDAVRSVDGKDKYGAVYIFQVFRRGKLEKTRRWTVDSWLQFNAHKPTEAGKYRDRSALIDVLEAGNFHVGFVEIGVFLPKVKREMLLAEEE